MKNKKKKVIVISLIVFLSIVELCVIAGICILVYINKMYSKTNYEEEAAVVTSIDYEEEKEMDEMYKDVTLTPPKESKSDKDGEDDEETEAETEAVSDQATVDSILLIGVDRRERNWNGNSDTMMLATINYDQKTVYVTSFLRDLYADIDGIGVRRLNHAYAVGGGPLCTSTITKNYGVRIDNYVSIDFMDFVRIVDRLGGVDVEITAAEAKWVNSYLEEINKIQGRPKNTDSIPLADGTYHLTGSSALAYCRIRYIGYDFERTHRQRIVLMKCIDKVKQMSIKELDSFLNDVMPYFSHNIDAQKVSRLISKLPSILNFQFVEMRVPEDGEYNIQSEILVPNDIQALRYKLQSTLYSK